MKELLNVAGVEKKLRKFHPCLVYNFKLGVLQVILRDCSQRELFITNWFDMLYDNHPQKGKRALVGFNLHRPYEVLGGRGYKPSSISIEHLILRYARYVWLPFRQNALGGHKEIILALVRKHQLVWHIPPELLLK